uniref:Transcriptional regulator, MarR family n=1 Tax=Parastrongyloides trichosuri TaxID=131310 RepID=A0A0N4ZD16_PARTI
PGRGAGDSEGPARRRGRPDRTGPGLLGSDGRGAADPARRPARVEGGDDPARHARPGGRLPQERSGHAADPDGLSEPCHRRGHVGLRLLRLGRRGDRGEGGRRRRGGARRRARATRRRPARRRRLRRPHARTRRRDRPRRRRRRRRFGLRERSRRRPRGERTGCPPRSGQGEDAVRCGESRANECAPE